MSANLDSEQHSGVSAATAAPEFLTFRIGAEHYGIDIQRVQEIRGFEAPTRLAGAPATVLGVINLRGLVVPIVDLRVRFGADRDFGPLTVTVVLNVADRTVGVVVDAVSDVLDLSPESIKPAPAFGGAFERAHIMGVCSLKEDTLLLLDIERLMTSADIGLAPVR